jgi:hypothetical protein
VEEKLPPVVLMVSPPHQKENISSAESVSIHFAPEMDEKSVTDGKGVKIIRMSNNKPLKGSWERSRQSTRFTFIPRDKFSDGEKYKIVVSAGVKNLAGTYLDKEVVSEFKISKR